MANTYTQLYLHVVFAIQNRDVAIRPKWEAELYKYITGIVQNKGQKMLAINGVEDHIHFLIGMKPACCLSDLVREIKKASTVFVNKNDFCRYKFQWQEGFGAFTYGHSQLGSIINYIQRQKEHHHKKSFAQEYKSFLRLFNVDFDERYLLG